MLYLQGRREARVHSDPSLYGIREGYEVDENHSGWLVASATEPVYDRYRHHITYGYRQNRYNTDTT